MLSTVNGIGNWFYDVYQGAKEGTNAFNRIDIEWPTHPEYKRQEGFEHLYKEMETKGVHVDHGLHGRMPLYEQELGCGAAVGRPCRPDSPVAPFL